MRPRNSDWQCHLSQLEKGRSRCAEFYPSADRIVRHMVLSGRHQDRRRADHRMGYQTWFRREVRNSVAREAEGRVPNDSYMKATHGRKLLHGDVANLSIGQGDTQVTPLQMAQAMAIVANGGIFYQTRLVQQVQSIDGGIVTAYNVREKRTLNFSPETMAQLRTGMVDAVNAPAGTAHAASLDTITVAGKTGTAQWGPKNKERTAAWFAGYVPAEKPQYAFAALY